MAKLTDKQERFVQELIKGESQRKAYNIAYPKSLKWVESAVDCEASKLFANTKVLQRYNALHDRLVKEAEDDCIVTAKEIMREFKDIAFDDISNYLRFYTNDKGEIRTTIKDSDTINSTKNIAEVSCDKGGAFKFKLYCKDNALAQLGKMLGMYTEKVEHSGTLGVKIIDDIK